MNKASLTFTKTCLTALFMLGVMVAWAQKPEIKSVDKISGSMEEIVTLKGSYFGTDATKLAVTFGASRGTILSVTEQVLVVSVPYGTTYHTIGVTNTATGLTGFSKDQFLLNFSGTSPLDLSNLQGQVDFPGGAPITEGLYDLCMCDFDGDKKVDVASANDNANFVNVYPNNSNVGAIAFPTRFSANISSRSLHIKCGDLNGDGKPDLFATSSGASDKVFVLKNNSTGPSNFAFSTPIVITLPGRPKRIEIADMDLNGKPELIVTSQATGTVSVLVNQSTVANIAFAPTPVTVPIPGAVSTEGLAVEDLNGDGMPEIITAQFQTNSDIYIIENKSSPGSYIAGAIKNIVVGTAIKNIRAGDLDGDLKPDIAYTKLTGSEVGFFLNKSTTTNISFTASPAVATDLTPWGLDFGDLDGDGKADIAVASITRKSITILNNKSTPGSLSFTALIKPTTYINRHVVICDADTDGKPDIAFTSIDDNNLNVPASKVSFFRNATCMIPEVTPTGPLNVCSGFALELVATKGNGVTYEWTNVTTSSTVAGTNKFSPTVSGDYFVTATSEGGTCKEVSNTVKVTIAPGTASDPLPVNDGPICVGQTLNLKITNDLGPGFTYEWSGPDNYTGTGITPTPVSNFQLKNAGIYNVDVKASSGCIALRTSTQVDAVDLPDFRVAFVGSALICQPDFKQLSVYPNVPNFTFQWFEKTGGAIAGATSINLLRNTSGEFYYEATSSTTTCPVIKSQSVNLIVVTPPVAAFTFPATACKGQEITFTNQSTFDAQSTLSYSWNFGDGTFSTEQNPKHTYATAGPFSVTLSISYPSNTCPATTSKPITITTAPDAAIVNALNKFELCENATLVLGLNDTFTSYLWSTGETSSAITVNEAGDYSVEVTATNGCQLKAVKTITSLLSPIITVSGTPELINEGETAQLTAEGVLSFAWLPTESLTDPTIANPVATPLTSTTYTVSGKDANGCEGTASVEIKVKGESVVSKLKPSNFFSPNGDPTGQYWVVEKIDEYPQCKVTIYDDKGVKVYEAKPYENNWEGTFNGGKRLPDGVYYYIIRCDGEENMPRTGSITIIR